MNAATNPAGRIDPFAPATLGPLKLRNRIIKAATYEHATTRGIVSDHLIRFHADHAAGGVGMTTVAYCAVSRDGTTDGTQVTWSDAALPGLRQLTDEVHRHGAAVSAQIGHAGPVADPRANKSPSLAPSRIRNPQGFWVAREASRADIARITALHGRAALRAVETGFDAVEVHLGHNYFTSSFLSPKVNRRTDEFGGSLENRARVPRNVLRAVRDAVGDKIAIVAKLGMADGVKGGFDVAEAAQVAQWIEADGSVDALELTAGSSLFNPMYLFRGEAPIAAAADAMGGIMGAGARVFGRFVLKSYPYQDAFLLPEATVIREAVSLPLILLGGITNADTMDLAMDSGFEFVAMGRALLREPDLINRLSQDRTVRSRCDHNNACMASIFTSTTRCVLVEQGHGAGERN